MRTDDETGKSPQPNQFPLFKKAEAQGLFTSDKGCLISAPTATGKSHLGIEIINRNLSKKPSMEIFLYLVPFKALAEEMRLKLSKLLQNIAPHTRLNIKTGDYDTPFDPRETDVLIATYESLDGMIQEGVDFYPSIIIADEFSIIADISRGARIESLISYLTKFKEGTKVFALSAVLKDPDKLAKWLQTDVLLGDEGDRPVKLVVEHVEYPGGKRNETVRKLVREGIDQGNFLIFCSTKKEAEALCSELRPLVARSMLPKDIENAQETAKQLKSDFPYLVGLPELVAGGVAYHHAGLEVDLRNRIGEAFNQQWVKVITSTTTLSAGVNLPARYVIVRDVTRYNGGQKLLPVSEIVNMLGRAGRPGYGKLGQDELGKGYFLIDKTKAQQPEYQDFIGRVEKRKVEELQSQIPTGMTNSLHFILSAAARMKGVSRDELVWAYDGTLAGFDEPLPSPLPTTEELKANIEKFANLHAEDVTIDERTVQVAAGNLFASGGSRNYEITISEQGCKCTCPAFKFKGMNPCKHIKQLQYETVFGRVGLANPEAKAIAISSLKGQGLKQHPLYMLSAGVELLLEWKFLEEKDGKMTITKDGRQALINFLLEMDHVRLLRDRIKKGQKVQNEEEIIDWAMKDYKLPEQDREGNGQDEGEIQGVLAKAFWKYIQNEPYKLILKQNQVRRFLDAKDRLDQIFNAYLAFCPREKKALASLIRTARRRVHYGCTKELLPLMVLDIDGIDEGSDAKTLYEKGIRDVHQLSRLDPTALSQMLNIPFDESKKAVQTSISITKLVKDFSGEKTQLGKLSVQTQVQIDNLLDYLLPSEISDELRVSY